MNEQFSLMSCDTTPDSSTCGVSTPAAVLLSNAQVDVFKKPLLPPLRKKKKKVLDEETYVYVS